jgi:hypothetical protein
MSKTKLIVVFVGYLFLCYLLLLAATNLYEPTRAFHLPGALWFTHLILLYIHEAGHLIFSIFGRTLNILGGSLMQVLAPFAWFIIAWRENSKLSNLALVFTGISIMDVSVYVKDATMLLLPLIGGLNKAHHDWLNLAKQYNFLEESYACGEILFWIGLMTACGGIINGVRVAILEFKEILLLPSSND